MNQVVISNEASEKVKGFFPWVYDNEVLRVPRNIFAGQIVEVRSTTGVFLGVGYINPRSRIAVRILSFKDEEINRTFFLSKIAKADLQRVHLKKKTNAYRIVHSEADNLPGLIIDSYGRHISVQINTAGMEFWRKTIIESICECFQPDGIYEKSDRSAREKEGLSTMESVLTGSISDQVLIRENENLFQIRLKESQKTGFYLDQRRNRSIVSNYVEKGFKVLDVFSNTGGFGIYAGRAGAGSVCLVDISQSALDTADRNIKLNNLKEFNLIKADAFDFLTREADEGKLYDMIILDPPSFTKTMQAKRGAIRGFKYLVSKSFEILNSGGFLALFSCSHHVLLDDLNEIMRIAAINSKLRIKILEHLFQDVDHPYLINFPQSLYLKGLLAQKD
jgi:23S rRNA (cytosine1962-C5)-methyltransferase